MFPWIIAIALTQPLTQPFLGLLLSQSSSQQALSQAGLLVAAPVVEQLAQSETAAPTEQVMPQTVRPLPGALNNVPVFNSNSPELVADPGILLSTFPPEGMASPAAHLNFPFEGRFDVFAHHVYKAADYDEPEPVLLDSLYLGVLVNNPGEEAVTVRVLSGASYLSQPDAPFVPLPAFVPFSPRMPVFAGPGSRAMGDILQGKRSDIFPAVISLEPGESALLMNQPIPIRELEPPINGRSTLAQLESNGPVYVASLAQLVELDEAGNEVPPSLASWEAILKNGDLAGPRDREPAPLPLEEGVQLIYGRVAGVSQGSQWQTTLVDPEGAPAIESGSTPADEASIDENSVDENSETTTENKPARLTIPAVGEAFSYGISLLYAGTMGTGQVQTAPKQ